VAAAATAAAALAGCGGAADNLPRQAVSGSVKFKGQPLKTGLIEFFPSEPGIATTGATGITDGSYSLPRSEGLQPGKYEVRISSAPQTAQRPPGAMPGDSPLPAAKELLPEKFNAKTTLSAAVTKDGSNTFDFDLQDK
jgi:hypothetical protein